MRYGVRRSGLGKDLIMYIPGPVTFVTLSHTTMSHNHVHLTFINTHGNKNGKQKRSTRV